MDISEKDGALAFASKRLTYRPFNPEDLPALSELVSDWRVVRQLGSWPWPPDPEFTKSRCKPYEGDGFVWAILRDDVLVGSIGITGGNLGYMLVPSAWGHGYATEAAEHALSHAFSSTDLDEITADAWVDNAGSQHVLAKLGFRRGKILISRARARKTHVPRYRFVLSRDRWECLRTPAQSTIARLTP